jgi:hypothetical protein
VGVKLQVQLRKFVSCADNQGLYAEVGVNGVTAGLPVASHYR